MWYPVIILVIVYFEPEEIYKKFEEALLKSLPADKPEFIEQLGGDFVGEKNRRKMNAPNQTRAGRAACVLQEIDTTPFHDEKFYKLLSAMKDDKHDLEILVQQIESHLKPGINLCISKLYYICVCVYTIVRSFIFLLW